jgi:hypothetical protein
MTRELIVNGLGRRFKAPGNSAAARRNAARLRQSALKQIAN